MGGTDVATYLASQQLPFRAGGATAPTQKGKVGLANFSLDDSRMVVYKTLLRRIRDRWVFQYTRVTGVDRVPSSVTL